MINTSLLKEINYANKMTESTPLKEKHMCIKMEYSSRTVKELRQIASDRGKIGYWKLRKAALIDAISRHEPAIVDEATKNVIDNNFSRLCTR